MCNLISWFATLISGKPHFTIGDPDNPYLRRWWLIPRNRWFNVYLHQFLRSDDDRALHCHPWRSFSVCLSGRMIEHQDGGATREIGPLQTAWRSAEFRHRIELVSKSAWTLFITGRKTREWGFWCPKGFVHWTEFTKSENSGEIGPGCEG